MKREGVRVCVCVYIYTVMIKDMVFPVGTYGCESWTIKKAER